MNTPFSLPQSNFKTLKVTALDLSLFNLQMAKQHLGGLGGVTFAESNAEHMAVENESQDVVTCNFVLSTMPAEAQVGRGEGGRLGYFFRGSKIAPCMLLALLRPSVILLLYVALWIHVSIGSPTERYRYDRGM